MQLTEAEVAIRPRNPWEAIDLGVLLARRHAGLLMASWALLTLPVLGLLTLWLWHHPSLALFLFWLLKPAFEPLPLYILSRALFGERPSLRNAIWAWVKQLKPELLGNLLWRRLSLARSFGLPILQLEGLTGAARRQRQALLGQSDSNVAGWLTFAGANLEAALLIGLMVLAYVLLPQAPDMNDTYWWQMLRKENGHGLWLNHLGNFFYALVLVIWEPIYVACGFSLYLNRRTRLEAWDIELVFRRLRQRLGTALGLLALALLLGQPMPAGAGDAADRPSSTTASGPQSPRLQHQGLSSQAARDDIQRLLKRPPFAHPQTETHWRLGPGKMPRETKKLPRLPKLNWLAQGIEGLLWALLVVILAVLVLRYRQWLKVLVDGVDRLRPAKRHQAKVDLQSQGQAERLPEDVAGEAEQLWDSDPRAALGLLYRGLLERLSKQWRVTLRDSQTENEILRQVAGLQREELLSYSRRLIRLWQTLAYGHRTPPPQAKKNLCDGWRQLFDRGQSTS